MIFNVLRLRPAGKNREQAVRKASRGVSTVYRHGKGFRNPKKIVYVTILWGFEHQRGRKMSEPASPGQDDLLSYAASIVSAYVSNNTLAAAELPALLQTVYATLGRLAAGESAGGRGANRLPAVSIKKSVTPDFLICLEDGKKFKSLKRHLRAAYGLSPEDYRARWNLAPDYPMVAPNYARTRSTLAVKMGLGQKTGAVTPHRKHKRS